MRRQVIIAFAILGLAACGQRQNQEAAAGSAAGAASATNPEVGAAANPDAASCLDLVANEMYSDAVPACERALKIDAANQKVKDALQTAQTKLTEMATKAAGEAADAAQGAADAAKDAAGAAEDAADAAKDAATPPPKTY